MKVLSLDHLTWVKVPGLDYQFQHFPMQDGMIGLPNGHPYYIMGDSTGQSQAIAQKYLNIRAGIGSLELTEGDISFLREYITQWFAGIWYECPFPESKNALLTLIIAASNVTGQRGLKFVLDQAEKIYIDPF